jgi:hypothetical protein
MSHTMKLRERIIEHHLRGGTNITENQFGFMPRRSTMKVIFFCKAQGAKRRSAYDLH